MLAFLAFVALDNFLKQKLAFADKNQAQLACFQQSDVKINFQRWWGILDHCDSKHYFCFFLKNLICLLKHYFSLFSSNMICYSKFYVSFWLGSELMPAKGQLILKYLLGVFNLPKNQRNFFQDFWRSNQKNKDTLYH